MSISRWLKRRTINKNSKALVYYGPHLCAECGETICRASLEQGGQKFDYPAGIIYPNTPWIEHSCASAWQR
jgi:hypothetical protein